MVAEPPTDYRSQPSANLAHLAVHAEHQLLFDPRVTLQLSAELSDRFLPIKSVFVAMSPQGEFEYRVE